MKSLSLVTILGLVCSFALIQAAPSEPNAQVPQAAGQPAPVAGPNGLTSDDYEDYEDELELEEELEEEEYDLAEAMDDYSYEKQYCDSLVLGKPDPADPTHIIVQADIQACSDDLQELAAEIEEERQDIEEIIDEEGGPDLPNPPVPAQPPVAPQPPQPPQPSTSPNPPASSWF